MSKITIQKCQEVAASKDGKCLSELYVRANNKLEWECKRGHRWSSTFANVQYGYWCAVCAGVQKQTIETCKNFALDKNGKCLSVEYINCKENLIWECEKGHQWCATFDNIKRGKWCPKCKNVIHTIQECKDVADKHNGKCLSTEYYSTNNLLEWECVDGHRWSATFGAILQGSWCKKCSFKTKRKPGPGQEAIKRTQDKSIKRCFDFAKSKGGKCLTLCIGSDRKVEWECEKGHRWKSRNDYIVSTGGWCKQCEIDEMTEKCRDYAIGNGGKLVSESYVTFETKLEWECENGHRWESDYGHVVKRDHWCPKCCIKKNQKKLAEIVVQIFPNEVMLPDCRSAFCMKNPKTGYGLELDIYFPNINLAVEYDGEQHFKPVKFNNISNESMQKVFVGTKYRDKLKNKLAKKGGIKLIRFNYKQKITPEFVREVLQQNGVVIPEPTPPTPQNTERIETNGSK